jgi:hypothetical protein
MEVSGQFHAEAALTQGKDRTLVGPRTGLDDVERRKLLPLQGLEL